MASSQITKRILLLVAPLILVASCLTPTETHPCDSYVQIVPTNTATPEFTWSPGCGVYRLAVTSNDMYTPVTLWSVVSPTSELYPAIRYGQLPAGAQQSAPATPLTPGSTVWATVYDGDRQVIGQVSVQVP